ncbi:hypothetical protein Ancab_015095 [Ancistrocladus abbreviatus]
MSQRTLAIASKPSSIHIDQCKLLCRMNHVVRIELLRRLHALLLVSGGAEKTFISTPLVNLYAHLGDISFACCTFDQVVSNDAYTWNSMISANVRCGNFVEAVNCFFESISTSQVQPDWYTFPPVLKACGNLIEAKRLHSWVFKLGFTWMFWWLLS